MSVIVDTSVWSLALRRKLPFDISPATKLLRDLIAGANTDFLICAVAHRRNYSILTTDNDFQNFQTQISILLVKVEG